MARAAFLAALLALLPLSGHLAAQTQGLDRAAIARAVVARMALKPGEKVLFVGRPGVFDTLTAFIRRIEPKGITVSVGGEIGEIGHQNSTPEDLHTFMAGFRERLPKGLVGISKISVQTGTTHGGVVLPDGSIAQLKLDFNTLKTLSEIAREEYGLAGAVQHGASTLPHEAFNKFAECETAEVHLATEFQNMIYESKHFPADLKKRIYEWLKVNAANETKQGETEEQFFYKTRKKALGQFKKEIMGLPQETRNAIGTEIENKFALIFKQLNAVNKRDLVDKYVRVSLK